MLPSLVGLDVVNLPGQVDISQERLSAFAVLGQ